jgi:hypothetical protein
VANALMIESRGRFSPFLPVADDDGIDLLIYDKVTGKALPAQVKSRTVALKKRGSESRGDLVHFELRRARFNAERYAAAILVLTSNNGYGIECAWVIPMAELPSISRQATTKFVVRPSKNPNSKDRCTRYRCNTMSTLSDRIASLLEHAPARDA